MSATVELVEKNKVFLTYNGSSVLLARGEQVSRDKYTPGQRLYVYVAQVEDEHKSGPRVTISRKNTNLVVKLFEMNTPELEDGSVEIIKIVRHAGFKTKIIVGSEYEEIDPAGSLIGPKGTRVKSIVEELSGEKIDIINYSSDIREMIAASLSPAQVDGVTIDTEQRVATCYVTKEEELRALGRRGQNIRLAEALTGYSIQLDVQDDAPDESGSE